MCLLAQNLGESDHLEPVSLSLIVYYDEYLIYFDKLKRKSLLEKREIHSTQKYKTQNKMLVVPQNF